LAWSKAGLKVGLGAGLIGLSRISQTRRAKSDWGGGKPVTRRRHTCPLCLNLFYVHPAIFSHFQKVKKPTVGFQARFFWENAAICKLLADRNLQIKEA
jgi:hypothetical protein